MASTYLYRQVSSSDTNKNKVTISLWFKKSNNGVEETLISGYMTDNNRWKVRFKSDDTLDAEFGYGGSWYSLRTNRKFRDNNAWYHCVMAYDTTQGTASERAKMYINGIQETSFQTEAYPPQNYGIYLVENTAHIGIGRAYYGGGYQSNTNWSGLISHVHVTDGYTYSASTFGSTDSTTGEWQINTSPSITMGNNGFTVLKDGNTITDQSSNSNNFTLSGSLTKTEDNPSNVFATLSPHIIPKNSANTGISAGNLRFTNGYAVWQTEASAFGVTSGKWYFEVQFQNNNGGDRRFRWGYQTQDFVNVSGNNSVLGGSGQSAVCFLTNGYSASNGGYEIGETQTNLTSDGDINVDNAVYGFALDLDNRKMYGHMSGNYFNSGNPSTGANGIDISGHVNVGDTLFPAFTTHLSNVNLNFGNGVFDATALTGTTYNDADGNGIFKYTVPTNYRALCTKGLNQ